MFERGFQKWSYSILAKAKKCTIEDNNNEEETPVFSSSSGGETGEMNENSEACSGRNHNLRAQSSQVERRCQD